MDKINEKSTVSVTRPELDEHAEVFISANHPRPVAFRSSVDRVKVGRPVGIRADLPIRALAD
jgi:hypothetical protein